MLHLVAFVAFVGNAAALADINAGADCISMVQLGAALRSGHRNSNETIVQALPDDVEKLKMLCGSFGLTRACAALGVAANLRTEPVLSTAHEDAHSDSKCLPPGKLVFIHVMKTGGLSVDWWLNRTCNEHEESQCSIQRLDFPPHDLVQPIRGGECAPSICTVGNPTQYPCPGFDNAKTFTIIRHPVDRVWSFFNMLREWYKPYQANSLAYVLSHPEIDFNEGLNSQDECLLCELQLRNAMSTRHFIQEGKGPKEVLASIDLVLDVKMVGHFPEAASSKNLFPEHPSFTGKTEFIIPRKDDLPYEGIPEHPDEDTARVIAQQNQKDVDLYMYAQTLPNYVGDGTVDNRWQSGA